MRNRIISVFEDFGIKKVGFCDFKLFSGHLLGCRAVSRLPENAKTVIVALFPYKVKELPPENISRYAAVPDYHLICGAYLQGVCQKLKEIFPQNKFEFFIDNSPLPEVFAASMAGLGAVGKNGLLINPEYGSFCFIGEIVTDLYIEAQGEKTDCNGCGKCASACPVGLDKSRCLSAVSQKKGVLTAEESAQLFKNGIIWGCDICAEVCPMNKSAVCTEIPEFLNGYRNEFTLGEDIKERAYEWRKEATVTRNYKNLNA